MTAPNRNTLWARTLAEELARHGLRHVCVGSGSRSAPLVEAFATDDRFVVHPHVDERSAGFFALGISIASGTPAAVVTTSGTATANLAPAVVEASQSDVPLLVLTADRPAILRGLDANQTIDQARLYGVYPRETIELPLPRALPEDIRLLRVAAARAWAAAIGSGGGAPGPTHVNVQFEKPLEPTPVPDDVPSEVELASAGAGARAEGRPFTAVVDGGAGTNTEAGRELAERLGAADRPLIVAGPATDPAAGPAVLEAAAAFGAPVLADPLSGARFAPGAAGHAVAWADAVLDAPGAHAALSPDLIVRVGPAPTSAAVQRFLDARRDVEQVVVDGGARWKDHCGSASAYVTGRPARVLAAATDGTRPAAGRTSWQRRWDAASGAAGALLETRLADAAWFEGSVAAAVVAAVPDGGILFVGNSMPIRDVDAFGRPSDRALRALGFRGASGIDGNISGSLGAAAGSGAPVLALIGDLTLIHDIGALFAARAPAATVQIVVIQNRGGGIFHMLPISEFDPPFTEHVVMPHDVDVAAVAEAAGIAHSLTASIEDLAAELAAGWSAGGIRIVEVRIEREENWARRRSALDEASAAVSERLAAE